MKIARFHKQSNRTQTVKEHLTNAGESCRQAAEKIKLSNTAYLIGILHDMGKLSQDFQGYIKSQMDEDEAVESKVDHGVYGAKYIFRKYENGDYIQKITSQIMAFVICYHHGGLSDCIDKNEIPLLKRMDKLSEPGLQEVAEEFEELFPDLTNIFAKACEEIQSFNEIFRQSNTKLEGIFFDIHLLIKTLYSILIDADWLDSYLFEAGKPPDNSKPLEADLDMYISNLQKTMDNFKLSRPVSEMQGIVFEKRNQIANDCLNFAKSKTGIYTLTVPTGGGKTLSSFGFALNHAKEHGKERIFYIAPYVGIIEQNAGQIRQSLSAGSGQT